MKVRVISTLLFLIILVANLIDGFLNTEFSLIVKGEVIKETIQSVPSISLKDCIKQCTHLLSCVSFNYNTQTRECQLSDKEVNNGTIVPETNDWNYIQSGKTPCLNSGTYIYKNKGLKCQCAEHFSGDLCEKAESIEFINDKRQDVNQSYFPLEMREQYFTDMTFCMWFRNLYPIRNLIAMDFYTNSSLKCNFTIIKIDENNNILMYNSRLRVLKRFNKTLLKDNKTYHICLAWHPHRVYLYINGKLKEEDALYISPIKPRSVVLGASRTWGNCLPIYKSQYAFAGDISLLNIWARVLNKDEVEHIYNGIMHKEDLIAPWSLFWNFTDTTSVRKRWLLTDA